MSELQLLYFSLFATSREDGGIAVGFSVDVGSHPLCLVRSHELLS